MAHIDNRRIKRKQNLSDKSKGHQLETYCFMRFHDVEVLTQAQRLNYCILIFYKMRSMGLIRESHWRVSLLRGVYITIENNI